jgi:hypothetical protein
LGARQCAQFERMGGVTHMSEQVDAASQPKQPGWWKRRSKKTKVFLIFLALVVALIAISAAAGGSSDKGTPGASNSANTAAANPATTTPKASPVVRGTWNADCNQYSAGDLSACKAIKVSKVTCQWQSDNVHMTVVFKNTFGAHVTVHMQPTYNLLNAGLHGNGLTSVKDVGLDPGEKRSVTVDENPAGVNAHPRIASCHPGMDILQGVELG